MSLVIFRPLLAAVLALAAAAGASAQQRLALLVGVGEYQNPAGVRSPITPLDGPVHDVEALRRTLTERWGFKPADVQTLVDRQATRAAILAALDDLAARARAGDTVFFFYSGHGASALWAGARELDLSRSTGALTPYDANRPGRSAYSADTLIIGRTDLQPRLARLDATGAHVWVVADACYSGQTVRALGRAQSASGHVPKMLPAPGDKLNADLAVAPPDWQVEPYPYSNVVYLAAAAQGELAIDLGRETLAAAPSYTLDGKPHGGLTDALLRVLDGKLGADADGDGRLTYRELRAAVADFIYRRGYGHTPQLLPSLADDAQGLGTRGVLGAGRDRLNVPLKPDFVAPSLKIWVEPKAAPVRASLARMSGVTLVGTATADRELSVQRQFDGPGWAVTTPSNDLIANLSADDPAEVTRYFSRLVAAYGLRAAATQGQRATLGFEVNPPHFGGNFVFGQKLNFVVRADRPARLLILNLDANGRWTTLYPLVPGGGALVVDRATMIPGEREQDMITVTPPEGMDSVFAFAFDEPQPTLDALVGLREAELDDPRLAALRAALLAQKGRYSFARAELRALPPPTKPAGRP